MRKSEIEGENQRHGEKKSLIETEILVERDREMTERQIERLNGESKVRNIPAQRPRPAPSAAPVRGPDPPRSRAATEALPLTLSSRCPRPRPQRPRPYAALT